MRGNVLIIDNVVDITNIVARYLSNEGLEVKSVPSAEAAFALLATWKCNLIILEINLPGMDGFEFLTEFMKTSSVPVFILSTRNSEEDQIFGLGIGADEYITKPFSAKVLTMRVRAMFRRMGMAAEQAYNEQRRLYNFGPYILDTDAKILKKDQKHIELAAKEYSLLAYLAENEGRPVAPETIYENVWEESAGCLAANYLTTVPVHIQRLRKKIEDDPAKPIWLRTSRGMGYKLSTT